MSISTAIITCRSFLPTLHLGSSRTRRPFIFSSSNIATVGNLVLGHTGIIRVGQNDTEAKRRLHVCNAVDPGTPPPSDQPPFNFIHWIVSLAAMVLPFFVPKWSSLLRIKNEVETAVEVVEDIAEAVGKVAEEVEKVAEDIAHDLPEGGSLRQAIDFVEHVAEKASDDAHLVQDFIHKVEEVEEKVEKSVEHWAEEVSTIKPPTEEEISDHIEDKPNPIG